MKVGPITVSMNTGLIQQQLAQAQSALEHLPKRRRRKFGRKLYRLCVDGSLGRISCKERVPTVFATQLTFDARILGIDELICAALRAGKRNV